ncbi:MAG: phosphate signaling complex protein PhoU [Syntrophobacterales bacterium]|nr:phosphate signaling complex protein PhoU [Syntrophobacterales bacterium]
MAEMPSRQPDKFRQEITRLKERLLTLAGMAEEAIHRAVQAFLRRDRELARRVIHGDREINDLEEAIDGDCVRLIALYQPVAADLRQIMAADHIIAELERIGDLAVNIAEEALSLEPPGGRDFHPQMARLAELVLTMVRRSLTAYVEQNPALAREVCRADAEVDELYRHLTQEVLREMVADEVISFGEAQISVARHLERVGDHATNIAEQVVYAAEGESIRHRCQG